MREVVSIENEKIRKKKVIERSRQKERRRGDIKRKTERDGQWDWYREWNRGQK